MCVLSVAAAEARGVWAIPVHCRNDGLAVDCLIPRWADAAFYLEQNPQVLLIFQDPDGAHLCWLQYRGRAEILSTPNWAELLPQAEPHPETRYLAVRVQPRRLDVIDESQGWGVLESLER